MNTQFAANIINIVLAGITLIAVLIAFYSVWMNKRQSQEDWRHTQELARIERQHQQRPILVPIGEIGQLTDGKRLELQNMGDGIAFNVHVFFFGYLPTTQCIAWNNGPIQGKSSLKVACIHGDTVLGPETKVDGTHVLYDASDPNYRVARLTMTYYDLFGICHPTFRSLRREKIEL